MRVLRTNEIYLNNNLMNPDQIHPSISLLVFHRIWSTVDRRIIGYIIRDDLTRKFIHRVT